MKLLSLHNVCVNISAKHLLEDISFEVNAGEVVSILGPNGSGKTTLASLIMNDFSPSTGYLEYMPNRKLFFRSVGVVYDNQAIFPYLKVAEYVDFFTSVYKMNYGHVKIYLECLDIIKIMPTQISKLSQGERMKLAIFLAIFHNPKFLVMDEPFSGIDPTIKDAIWGLIKQKAETIIMSSHDWDLAEKIADKIVFLNNGKLLIPPFNPLEFKKLLPASKKIVFSLNGVTIQKMSCFETYYKEDDIISVFYSDSSVLDKVKTLTHNYSILECSLKDLYFYFTQNKAL